MAATEKKKIILIVCISFYLAQESKVFEPKKISSLSMYFCAAHFGALRPGRSKPHATPSSFHFTLQQAMKAKRGVEV
jgi:hypothetical protein